ncbi:sensor histidine kinase [Priestia filamentosa]|uniref:sensor histidine kinase n=1 Tax=Priestia filamentosa TaxID=1402861 RepID=UPI002895F798|nr:HAMP domain-containing sensor histidine kinase [Priestia filamentosa]MDT3766170.1 HAMP domain-containing sensor histidine kinase [Priestia filamentosa]
MAGLSRTIIESIIPMLNKYEMNFEVLNDFLYYLRIATGFFSIYFCPWGFLMHAIEYSERFSDKTIRILKYILFIPIFFMLKTTTYVPDIVPDFTSLLYWGVPYLLIGYALHLYSYFTELDPEKKIIRFTTFSIMHPIMISALIFNYIIRAFDNKDQYFRLVVVFVLLSFILFLWKALDKNGLGSMNGIKIYRKQNHIKTNRAILTGTNLINHAIKNQVYKINTGIKLLKRNMPNLTPVSKESVDMIESSSTHLMNMVETLNNKTQEIKIIKTKNDVNQLLNEVLENLKSEFRERNISIQKHYELDEAFVLCAKAPTKEVFMNLLRNSMEAMEGKGQIQVRTSKHIGNKIVVTLSDNGIGIEADHLKHVKDPFFTTKKTTNTNFGWGLYYCYDVMMKSDGSLAIDSEVNKGTTIKLTFLTKG